MPSNSLGCPTATSLQTQRSRLKQSSPPCCRIYGHGSLHWHQPKGRSMADFSLQLQADNLPRESVEELLVEGHWAPILRRLTTGENLLLEGCRGVGKTMLMRAASARLAAS